MLSQGAILGRNSIYFSSKAKFGRETLVFYEYSDGKARVFSAFQTASVLDDALSKIREDYENGERIENINSAIYQLVQSGRLWKYDADNGSYGDASVSYRRAKRGNSSVYGNDGEKNAGRGTAGGNQEVSAVSDYRRAINYEGQLSLDDSVSPRDEFLNGFRSWLKKVYARNMWYQGEWLDLLKAHPEYDFVSRITDEGDCA